jgi:hypothetical protein
MSPAFQGVRYATAHAALLSLALLAQSTMAAPPASNHPILGIWMLTMPDGSCSETYRFRGDGTTLVSSAEEISESEFAIAAEPSETGFYKLEDRNIKGNGKKDCSGNIMKTGGKVTHFLQFHPSGNMFIMCVEETLDACIGPFRRMPGEGN